MNVRRLLRTILWRRRLGGLGKNSVLEPGVLVVGNHEGLFVGDASRILHRSVFAVGASGIIRIGDRTHVGVGSYFNATKGSITVGDDTAIANMVQVYSYSNWPQAGFLVGETYRVSDVVIGSNVLIGAGVIVLPGVRVGDSSVIGAGAVVNRDVTPGTVVAGVPARLIGRAAQGHRSAREYV